MMQDGLYYRPIPQDQGGRWPLAGGWTGFTHLECLQRGAPPRIVDGTNVIRDPDGYAIELYQRPAAPTP